MSRIAAPMLRAARALALTAVLATSACVEVSTPQQTTLPPQAPPASVAQPAATLAQAAATAALATSLPPATDQAASTPFREPTAKSSSTAFLEGQLDEFRSQWGSVGALAVLLENGQRTFAASGTADEAGTSITPDTRFRIASITKAIMATLVMEDVADGVLSLDDVVNDLLPDVLGQPPVTVRELLSHTSGIVDEINEPNVLGDVDKLTDPEMAAEARDILERSNNGEPVILTDRLIVALAETHPRYFLPGTGYHYSSTNYQLAGMLLEKDSGESLSDLLAQKVVSPLGLEHTSMLPPDMSSPELRGYTINASDGSRHDATDGTWFFGNGGAGGIIATPDDLLSMFQALVQGQLAPADEVALMEQPMQGYYGLGLGKYLYRCGTFYGHEGLTDGTESIALVSPSGDKGVVLAVNLVPQGDNQLLDVSEQLLCGPSLSGR